MDNVANSYDPTKVNVYADSKKTVGFAEGTMISGNRNTDKQSFNVGSKGETTFVQSADKTGTIEITLKHNSASLSHYNQLFMSGKKFSISVSDTQDGSRIGGTQAKVASMGNYERGDDVSDKTITVLVADYDEFFRGVN